MEFCVVNDEFGIDDGKSFKSYGKDIEVLSWNRNRDTNEVSVECAFTVGNEIVQVNLPLNDRLVSNLQKAGYPITSSKEQYVRTFIDQQLKDVEAMLLHTHIGWEKENDVLGFKGVESIGYKDKSTYDGKLCLDVSSNYKDFRTDYTTVIEGNTTLEFAIVMGLSGCMVGYLNCACNEQTDTLIYDIYGGSTTGKTTILRLAVSTCGNPYSKTHNESLFGTCSATSNALIAKLHDNYGMFISFDEVGRLNRQNMDGFLYQIADGTGKARCNIFGNIRSTSAWTTAVGFTGELSILDLTDNKDGLLNRVFSFNNVKWTNSAKQAINVDEFSRKHCGEAVYALANFLLKCNPDDILKEYKGLFEELQDVVPVPEQYLNRAAKKVSVLVMTARSAMKALKISINEQELRKFIFKSAFSEFRLEHERALERFQSLLFENIHKFNNKKPLLYNTKSTSSNSPHLESDIGYYYFDEKYSKKALSSYVHCVISSDVFNTWMKKEGFSNINGILREWRKAGILESQKDRFVEKRYIHRGGIMINTYKFHLFFTDNEEMKYLAWINSFSVDLKDRIESFSGIEKEYAGILYKAISQPKYSRKLENFLKAEHQKENNDFSVIILDYFKTVVDKIEDYEGNITKTSDISDIKSVEKMNSLFIQKCEQHNCNYKFDNKIAVRDNIKYERKEPELSLSELMDDDDDD